MPRLRVPLAVATLAPPALDWATRHPALDPPRYVTLRVLDQNGVRRGRAGCIRHRIAEPLLPRVPDEGAYAGIQRARATERCPHIYDGRRLRDLRTGSVRRPMTKCSDSQ